MDQGGPSQRGEARRGGREGAGGGETVPAPNAADLIAHVEWKFQGSDDIIVRRVGGGESRPGVCVVYAEGMVDTDSIEEAIVRPVLSLDWGAGERAGDPLARLRTQALFAAHVEEVASPEEACDAVLTGDVLVLVAGEKRGLKVKNRAGRARGVENPILEVTLRGPRDSFTETLAVNTALIRRRLKDPNLRVKKFEVGRRSKTGVALIYIEGITPEKVVREVERRVRAIDIDAILDTGSIEHLIEDSWWSPFPQHLKTERPDRAVASLLDGRAVLIADTTPFALMMPATLDSFFHSPEDKYDRWFPVKILRVVRFTASFLSLTAPSLYVALVAYHPGILPTQFLLKVKAARDGVAFPVLVEALIIMFFLELIKEAGFRMPGPIGQIFGIVGGLILGDVGVRAGIVSEAMVIVVAITAISSFTAIDREIGTVLRLLGLPLLASTAIFGLPGLVMALTGLVIHLASLRSYGVPYLDPYRLFQLRDFQDTVVQTPLNFKRRRPVHLGSRESTRLGSFPRDKADTGGGPAEGDV